MSPDGLLDEFEEFYLYLANLDSRFSMRLAMSALLGTNLSVMAKSSFLLFEAKFVLDTCTAPWQTLKLSVTAKCCI